MVPDPVQRAGEVQVVMVDMAPLVVVVLVDGVGVMGLGRAMALGLLGRGLRGGGLMDVLLVLGLAGPTAHGRLTLHGRPGLAVLPQPLDRPSTLPPSRQLTAAPLSLPSPPALAFVSPKLLRICRASLSTATLGLCRLTWHLLGLLLVLLVLLLVRFCSELACVRTHDLTTDVIDYGIMVVHAWCLRLGLDGEIPRITSSA